VDYLPRQHPFTDPSPCSRLLVAGGLSDSVVDSIAYALRDVLGGMITMSIDVPTALASGVAVTAAKSQSATSEWVGTALTVLFAAAAVLFVSLIAVVTGLA
jgi:hypothetical protein